jgi:hypothetical protein
MKKMNLLTNLLKILRIQYNEKNAGLIELIEILNNKEMN